MTRVKSEVEKAIVLACLPQGEEVVHLKHGRFWEPEVAVHHVDAYGEPPAIWADLNGGDAIMVYKFQ